MQENSKGQHLDREDQQDLTGANSDHQNASGNRGGTTDMGSEALRDATGTTGRAQHGSGISTKRNVTGSDYDGQVSESNQG